MACLARSLIEERVEVPEARRHHYVTVRALTRREGHIKGLEIENSLGRWKSPDREVYPVFGSIHPRQPQVSH